MSEHRDTKTDAGTGTFGSYTIGFVLAVGITLIAFASVIWHPFSDRSTLVIIVGAAVVQLLVHMHFFLHLSRQTTPRANLVLFAFMLLVAGLLIGGSLWIMFAAQNNMMPKM